MTLCCASARGFGNGWATVGAKARAVIIDFYGLYGSRGRQMDSIARKLETTTPNVVALRDKALQQMRVQRKQAELEELIVSTAQSILTVCQKEAAERGQRQTLTPE
jgi:hypothetical protein